MELIEDLNVMKLKFSSVFGAFTFAMVAGLSTVMSAQASDLSKFAQFSGLYKIDRSFDPHHGPCQSAKEYLEVSVDVQNSDVILARMDSADGATGHNQIRRIELNSIYEIPSMSGHVRFRYILRGSKIVEQTQSYLFIPGPWSDNGFPAVEFSDPKEIQVATQAVPCKYVKQ